MDKVTTTTTGEKGRVEFLDVTEIKFILDMEKGIEIELKHLIGGAIEKTEHYEHKNPNQSFYISGEIGNGKIILDLQSGLGLIGRLKKRVSWIKKVRVFFKLDGFPLKFKK